LITMRNFESGQQNIVCRNTKEFLIIPRKIGLGQQNTVNHI